MGKVKTARPFDELRVTTGREKKSKSPEVKRGEVQKRKRIRGFEGSRETL